MHRLIPLTIVLATLTGCSKAPDVWKDAKPGQIKILTSFPPIYCLTHAIAGEHASVQCMLTTTGPHEYHHNATDALKFKNANLIIVNGLDLDNGFMTKLLRSSGNRGARTITLAKELPEKMLLEGTECVHDGHVHKHGDHDPHVWLGLPHLAVMVDALANELAGMDSENKSAYLERGAKLKAELQKIHDEGKAALAGKKLRSIVTQHESMRYFAQSFDLDIVGSLQTAPGVDPDAATLSKLVKLCQQKQVGVIAVEPQYSRAQAEILQRQLQKNGLEVRIVEFDPLETAPAASGTMNPEPGYFLEKLRQNVANLTKALS